MRTQLDLLGQVDALRREANQALDPRRKALLGQFLTPLPVATLMASMLAANTEKVRDRKSTRLNSSHIQKSRMPSSA